MRRVMLTAVLLAGLPGGAAAQVAGGAGFERWDAGTAPRTVGAAARAGVGPPVAPRSVGAVGLGALAGAAAGVVIGATIGYHLDRATECNDDYCGLDGILIGGSLGSTLLTPVGAHLANGRGGSLLTSLVVTAAGTGAVWLLAAGSGDEEIILAVPLVNMLTSLIVERSTGDR